MATNDMRTPPGGAEPGRGGGQRILQPRRSSAERHASSRFTVGLRAGVGCSARGARCGPCHQGAVAPPDWEAEGGAPRRPAPVCSPGLAGLAGPRCRALSRREEASRLGHASRVRHAGVFGAGAVLGVERILFEGAGYDRSGGERIVSPGNGWAGPPRHIAVPAGENGVTGEGG